MIEDEYMEKPEDIESNQHERKMEAVDLEKNEREKTNKRLRRVNSGMGLSASKLGLELKHMTLNSPPALGRRKHILCMTCTN